MSATAAFAAVGKTELMVSYSTGEFTLTRVPYFDIPLDAQIIGFTPSQVRDVAWGAPKWSTADAQVLVGQAIWVIEAGDQTIVVDPCGAADEFIRTGSEAATHEAAVVAAMASAGHPVASVDTVVMSHLDGIGMVASLDESGGSHPLFPKARVVTSERELAYVKAGHEIQGSAAFLSLVEQGCVEGAACPAEIAPGITLEVTGGHSPGHAVLRLGDDAVFIGHLLINPIQVVGGVMPGQHYVATEAFNALERELAWAAEHEALVVGPLWPEPGAGRVAGPPWTISPA